MSVNLSPRQYRHPNFIEMVDEVLAETGMEIRGDAMRARLLDHGLETAADGERILFTSDRDSINKIWIADFESGSIETLTDWVGTDNYPMWHGDTIYFTSDREHTLNIFALDPASGETVWLQMAKE